MDTLLGLARGFPIEFTGYEIESCYSKRGIFRISELRQYQKEKGMQIILANYHGIVTAWPDELYRYVTITRFSIRKARYGRPGYLMTIEYRFQEATWRHVFRYQRNRGGISVSGRLYTYLRRRIVAK